MAERFEGGGVLMGGMVIETVRPGVQFVPDAAAAFRRADAQVRAEFGRGIDVNSTYRSWNDQMVMFVNWGRYVAGKGPYPGHSKAVHPSESFHVAGIALDSDDWRIARIVAILAENGFIRNRLHVANENHHFEWLRDRDQHYGEPIDAPAPAGGATAAPVPKEDEIMEAYVAVPSGAVVHLFPGGRHVFGSKQEYDAYRGDVNFIRARDGLSMATVPPLEAIVNLDWAQFERFRRNFGVPDDGAFQGETIDVEKLAKDLAARMGYDVASVRAAVRAELATLTLKAG